ncbi:hypothetical protein XELAEV_18032558mg [Xenopus laevis]|uniref:F-box domain-containing protein n=1 Tax=Xenopus laevis TaxID=8355 RepID=A0A974HH53_XENLA|nr:hypothetical protein XELAEV_18032558mg [Xenopus laevis]
MGSEGQSAPGRGRKRRAGNKPGKRKRRAHQPRPSFYIHHTDRDMLLLISNQEGEGDVPVSRRRKEATETPGAEPPVTDSGWGCSIPLEILHGIFLLLVQSEGAVPTLCRLSRVCRRWNQVASSPHLWLRVSIGFCWGDPGKKQPPKTQSKIRETLEWLIKERSTLAASCPRLSSLTLSHCTGVSADSLFTAAQNCPELLSLNLQNSQVESPAVLGVLDVCGPRLQRLFLTYSNRLTAIMSSLTSGSCPELRVLELSTEIKQGESHLQICIETLQTGCPKLEVLRLLNLVWSPKSGGRCVSEALGFVHLQELCLATSSYSFVSDSVCQRLLRDSAHLKILDLRGCYRVTPGGICQLPCVDLERLYLGIYCSTKNLALPRTGCSLIAQRWQHSLQELDITAHSYSEEDLAQALNILSTRGSHLHSLNLAGTKVMSPAVRELLSSCPSLMHLDLSSCRYLPRGMKRVYRGEQDIRQCLAALTEELRKELDTE